MRESLSEVCQSQSSVWDLKGVVFKACDCMWQTPKQSISCVVVVADWWGDSPPRLISQRGSTHFCIAKTLLPCGGWLTPSRFFILTWHYTDYNNYIDMLYYRCWQLFVQVYIVAMCQNDSRINLCIMSICGFIDILIYMINMCVSLMVQIINAHNMDVFRTQSESIWLY